MAKFLDYFFQRLQNVHSTNQLEVYSYLFKSATKYKCKHRLSNDCPLFFPLEHHPYHWHPVFYSFFFFRSKNYIQIKLVMTFFFQADESVLKSHKGPLLCILESHLKCYICILWCYKFVKSGELMVINFLIVEEQVWIFGENTLL